MSFFEYHNQTLLFNKNKFCHTDIDLTTLFDLWFVPNKGLFIPFSPLIGSSTYLPDLLHYHNYLRARKLDPNITCPTGTIDLDLMENIAATEKDSCVYIDLNLNIHHIGYEDGEFTIYKYSNRQCTYCHIRDSKFTDDFSTCIDIAIEKYYSESNTNTLSDILGQILSDAYILQCKENVIQFHLSDVEHYFNSKGYQLAASSISK